MKEVKITPGSRLASFDVKALCLSIFVKKSLEIAKDEQQNDKNLSEITEWSPKEIVVDQLQICLETHFKTLDG